MMLGVAKIYLTCCICLWLSSYQTKRIKNQVIFHKARAEHVRSPSFPLSSSSAVAHLLCVSVLSHRLSTVMHTLCVCGVKKLGAEKVPNTRWTLR